MLTWVLKIRISISIWEVEGSKTTKPAALKTSLKKKKGRKLSY
jgi:hypothetical protein